MSIPPRGFPASPLSSCLVPPPTSSLQCRGSPTGFFPSGFSGLLGSFGAVDGLCWVLTLLVPTGNDCETFWDKDHLTNSCYQFNFQSTLSWREAWNSCEQQGANLLSITEIHEQTYINGEMMAAWLRPCPPRPGQSWWHHGRRRCQVALPARGGWFGDGDRLGVELGLGGLILPLWLRRSQGC